MQEKTAKSLIYNVFRVFNGCKKEQKPKKTEKNSISPHATDCYAILRFMNDFSGFFGRSRAVSERATGGQSAPIHTGAHMTKKAEIVADLKTLLEAGARTKMGKVWEVYDELLELRQSGVSVSDIEAKLNSRGFNLKPGNLTSYMYQIKKKKERENTSVTIKEPKSPKLPKAPKAPAAPVQGQLDEKKASAKSNNLFDKFAKSTVIEPITIEKPEF